MRIVSGRQKWYPLNGVVNSKKFYLKWCKIDVRSRYTCLSSLRSR